LDRVVVWFSVVRRAIHQTLTMWRTPGPNAWGKAFVV